MTSELEPWTGSRDVIGGALALDFDQNFSVHQFFTVPFLEWFKKLKTVRFWIDDD